MNIRWKLTLYYVGTKSGYKVKVEGNPRPGPWVFAQGQSSSPHSALEAALEEMAERDRDDLRAFLSE